jgi:hypothetical protein
MGRKKEGNRTEARRGGEYSSTKYSVSGDVSVRTISSAGIFQ